MKRSASGIQLLFFTGILLVMCSGCEIVGDIFEFGFWAGVIVVILVIAIIIWLIRKFFS